MMQRDVVSSYLDSGRSVDEQGVEDAFELLHETSERVRTGLWVGDCFIYNNSSWRLNYCVGGEVIMIPILPLTSSFPGLFQNTSVNLYQHLFN